MIGVDTRVLAVVGRPAINLYGFRVGRAFGLGPLLAFDGLGIFGQCKLNHISNSPSSPIGD